MKTFDDIDIGMNDLLQLYKRKEELIAKGDLSELIKLKKYCPDLFVEEKKREVDETVYIAKYLMEHPHFKAMYREEEKRKLIPVDYDQWKSGALAELLDRHEKIYIKEMREVSRELAKEAIVTSQSFCEEQEQRNVSISEVFPFLGLLIAEIIIEFPQERRVKMVSQAMFKINGEKEASPERQIDSKMDEWKSKISCYSNTEQKIRNSFRSMLNKIFLKCDTRKEFRNTALLFLLVEVTDFIGLLIQRIGMGKSESESLVINRIESNISYGLI